MDYDVHPQPVDQKSDLLWLIQQCLDSDLNAIEMLLGTIAPTYFLLSDLLAPEIENRNDFAREGLVYLLWKLKEYEEADDFDSWWKNVFFRYLHDFRAENPKSGYEIFYTAGLDRDQVDQLILQESGIISETKTAASFMDSQAGKEIEFPRHSDLPERVDPSLSEKIRQEVRVYIDKRKLEDSPQDSIRYQEIAREAGELYLLRRENVRKRLVVFQLIWGFFGLIFLVGAFQFGGNIFAAGDSINTTMTPAITSSTIPTSDPFSTPTRTPQPYEKNQANGPSFSPDLSADGRWIVYSSDATNLVPNDTNGFADIFLYDRLNRQTSRITELPDGTQADGPSYGPSISPDGTWIAFVSFASNLAPHEKNVCVTNQSVSRPCADVYLIEVSTGEIILVSRMDAEPGNRDSGLSPQAGVLAAKTAISESGRSVAFFSYATNLGADPVHGGLFLYKREESGLFRIDKGYDGSIVDGASYAPSLTHDGNLLAFQSEATNLVPDDLNQYSDIFVYDVQSSEIIRVTTGQTGTGAVGASAMPDLSGQGTTIVFRSNAADLVEIENLGQEQIFAHNLVLGETSMISIGAAGSAATGPSNLPGISGGGNNAVFISVSDELTESAFNGTWDVFSVNLISGETQLLSVGLGGQAADGVSSFPKISEDGFFVVFVSDATNLVPGDENGVPDIFLFQGESAIIQRINTP
jgi:Tol biopolymer transport system component